MKATTLFLLFLFLWGNLFAQSKRPIVLGDSYEINSVLLSEKRTLNIYLPPNYMAADTVRYPVIYLLDGGTDEDFIHVVGIVQFNNFSWVARVPESIVVGIVNTDRKRDMTYPTTVRADKHKYPTTGGSAKFISFIEEEVQPYVNNHFRAGGSKTIIGESLGGLLAAEILITKPYLFDKYIIVSPSIWWDNGSLLKRPTEAPYSLKNKTDVYIAVGKEGLTPGEQPRVMEVDANLLKERIEGFNNRNISVYLDYLPGETHATIAHQAVFNGFRWLYPAREAK